MSNSFYRSDDMHLYRMSFSKDQEWEIVNVLGQRQMSHMLNLNAEEQVFNLPYISWIKRCEDSERRIRFLKSQCNLHKIDLVRVKSIESLENLANFIAQDRKLVSSKTKIRKIP